MSMIAERAKCTRGAIYWHFRGQAELLQAVLARGQLPLLERLEAVARSPELSLDALRRCLLQVLQEISSDEQARITLEIMAHCCEFPKGYMATPMERWREEQELIRATLGRILQNARIRGEIGQEVDCLTGASLICFILMGALKFELMRSARLTPDCIAMLISALEMFFDSIAVKPL